MAEDKDDNQDKTEDPSQYRLEKSKEKGDVVSSKDLTGIMVVAAAIGTLLLTSAYMFEEMWVICEKLLNVDIETTFTSKEILILFNYVIISFLKIMAPLFLILMIVAFLTQIMQIGVVYAPDLITMKLERISPQSGLGRIFSSKSLFEFFKGLIKFILVFSVTYMVLNKSIFQVNGMIHSEISASMFFMKSLVMNLVVAILLTLAFVAMIDFAYEKWTYLQRMKMSKQEMKEELL